jgi:DNA-binding NtrC family response regulator
MGREVMTLSTAAIKAFELYDWPGNVREMENVIERTVALTDSDLIKPQDLPSTIGNIGHQDDEPLPHPTITSAGIDLPATMAEIERGMIEDALQLTSGVKARAANILQINRTTLVEKMKRLGLEL